MIDWVHLYRSAGAPGPLADALGAASAAHLPGYGLTTPARIVQFMGQAKHETMGFRRLREIWGPTAAQLGYEGRIGLGNTQPGDGKRYMGRGIFQITGRANYAAAARRFGTDFVAFPELIENPEWAVRTAGDFWATHGLGALADAGDGDAISLRINGMRCKTLPERRQCVAQMRVAIGNMEKMA